MPWVGMICADKIFIPWMQINHAKANFKLFFIDSFYDFGQ